MPERRAAGMRVLAGGEPKTGGQGPLTLCAIGTGAVMAKHRPEHPQGGAAMVAIRKRDRDQTRENNLFQIYRLA